MAQNIHARKTAEGKMKFRLWSTISNRYLTLEMTEEEIRLHTLKVAVCDAIALHASEIEGRLERAAVMGTSCLIADGCDIHDPWEEERE